MTRVSTDGSGNAAFQVGLSAVVPAGESLSSTATDLTGDTSEFSADVAVASSSTALYAANDSYNVDAGTSLVVAAPGVLANDLATNGGPLAAALVAGSAHGTLTLNGDGSFSYTPAANFTGVDTFTDEDVQGPLTSNVATVSISVNPKTLYVTNTADGGPGSLRQAILGADLATSAAPDAIRFNIPGSGPFVISPGSPLPALTHATVVDGYSQPGSYPNTLARGDNAKILVRIDGAGAGVNADGLVLSGGGSTVSGLSITGFSNGIHLEGSVLDRVTGDFLGVDASGSAAFGNSNSGVFIDGVASVTVGGSGPAARDVISGNASGVVASSSPGDVVLGDFLGTDRTGTLRLPNAGNAVTFTNSPDGTIGGPAPGAGNVISGNIGGAIVLNSGYSGPGSPVTLVQGNLIGGDVTGARPLGNGFGLSIGSGDTILGNVISANAGNGVSTISSGGNVFRGNFIGVDATGTVALGNSGDGLYLSDSGGSTIGGAAPGAGNVIAANTGSGIFMTSEIAGDNLIQGNFIGVDITGTKALGDGGDGITDLDEYGNTIGGPARGAGNVISANAGFGVVFSDVFASHNVVRGNFIGTDPGGTLALGNGRDGISSQLPNNTIGGLAAGDGNTIAYNGGSGVGVVDGNESIESLGVSILSNSIYGNTGLGIDLGDDGVTPDSPGGPHQGPNELQNFPVLASAVASASSTTIKGTFNSTPDATFTLQFFSDPAADPTGHGQGQTLLGSATVTTDASGNASFSATFRVATPAGRFVSATATSSGGDTSEFSRDLAVTAMPPGAPAATRSGASAAVQPEALVTIAAVNLGQTAPIPVDEATLHDLAINLVRSKPFRASPQIGESSRQVAFGATTRRQPRSAEGLLLPNRQTGHPHSAETDRNLETY